VSKIRRILGELDFDIATPNDAREMMATKGVAHVGF
jgi:uncharacterized protein (DUF849 family)